MPNLKLVPNTNMKIIDVQWFNGRDTVGIVLIEDMTMHYVKAYVGVGNGISEQADAEAIAQWGSKISQVMAEALFGPLPEWQE